MCHKINSETIDFVQFHDFTDKSGLFVLCAHPHYDTNGDYYCIGTHGGRNGFYAVYEVPENSFDKEDPMTELAIHAKIPNDSPLKPCYYHSFALSEIFIAMIKMFDLM